MEAITIAHLSRAPGRYEVTASVGQKGRRYTAECNDAGDAAAKAVSYGMQLKDSGKSYVILGAQHILDMIPTELRVSR